MRKLAYACLSLVIAASLTFILMKNVPGDPFQQEQALPDEIYAIIQKHYGLDQPLYAQYAAYLAKIPLLDFGPSLVHKGRTVRQIIFEGLPTSALLGTAAIAIAIPLGLLLGILAALYHNSLKDSFIVLLSIIGISIPSFILATLLQYVLGIELGLFPIARWGSLSHVVLPALSLAALPTAFIARMTRSKMIEELRQGYISTARAKGLPEHTVVLRHALRNILAPIFGYLGPLTANILTGSFIIEKIYSIPGLGYWFVTSVLNRDYPLIMGITVFYCALLLAAVFLADMIHLLIDPRLRNNLLTSSNSR